jgi:hypothetical protein
MGLSPFFICCLWIEYPLPAVLIAVTEQDDAVLRMEYEFTLKTRGIALAEVAGIDVCHSLEAECSCRCLRCYTAGDENETSSTMRLRYSYICL